MEEVMRLLVCGGREFDDVPWLWRVLDEINARRIREHGDGIRCLIDGGQQKKREDGSIVGADYWAHQWALARGSDTERYHANWKDEGRSAGPKRNRRMAQEGRPTHGLAMPGGNGTADMVRVLRGLDVPVRVERPSPKHRMTDTMTDDVEHDCPECGRALMESYGTSPSTGRDEHTFQCFGNDCYSTFEADEILERNS